MMTIRSPFILVLAAIVLTACAMAGAGNGPATTRNGTFQVSPAFRCALRLTETNDQIAVEARIQSATAVSGSYALDIVATDGGANIHQSGDFQSAGPTPVILGTADLGGAASDYATTLTVRAGDRVLACPVEYR